MHLIRRNPKCLDIIIIDIKNVDVHQLEYLQDLEIEYQLEENVHHSDSLIDLEINTDE